MFDLVIDGGTVIDGTRGARSCVTDIGVRDGRIVARDDLSEASAQARIDATGKVVCPGFIDVHIHSEAQLLAGGTDLYAPSLQGVTTHLTAADGFGWAGLSSPVAQQMWQLSESIYGAPDGFEVNWPTPQAYRDAFRGKLPVNLVLQVPHHAVHGSAMGFENRPASDAERAAMETATDEWLTAGAVSLGLGLDYIPGGFSDERELTHLARVVASTGGVLQSHARFTELGRIAAWEEMLRIGRDTGIRVNISHATLDEELVELIAGWTDAVDLGLDSYLYPAGCTHLMYLIPTVHQVPVEQFLDALAEPAGRAAALSHFQQAFSTRSDPALMTIGASRSGTHDGSTLADLIAGSGRSAAEEALALVEAEMGDVVIVYGQAVSSEQFARNVAATLSFPNAMIASDGIYRGGRPHPRGFGCFVRVLGTFVREQKLLTLEEAIHRMSGLPAARYGLSDRGQLEPGRLADVAIFDPMTVADGATWADPRRPPTGVDRVLVNGVEVVRDGVPSGRLPGRVR